MSKRSQTPETYNEIFTSGGAGRAFELPYRRSAYYPLFKAVRSMLLRQKSKKVLEVGCGSGGMAHLLLETTKIEYEGFDFSPVAIDKARSRTGRGGLFTVGDATSAQTYVGRNYDSIICTEVLEHIEMDREAIALWRRGAYCVCSVPNYDADTHVRYFRSEKAVRERYGDHIEIAELRMLRKPFLNDLSLSSWLRAVRWNRYRPERLKWLMGFTNFERDGGWYIFAGKKR